MQIANRVLERLFQQLNDSKFIERHRRFPKAFTRLRKLTFAIVSAMIIQLITRSLQIECNLLADRLDMDEPVSKQAFSKARYKISYTGFKALNDTLLNELYTSSNEGSWKGYRVLGIDGSTIRLPESEELEEYFGRWDRGADRNGNCPILARISEIVELTTGVVVDAEIAPPEFGENSLADEQIQRVCHLFDELGQEKRVFVFDRGYPSKSLIKTLVEGKADFIFRLPKDFNKTTAEALKRGKKDVTFQFSDDTLLLRLVKTTLPSGEDCVLLTSFINQQMFSAEDLFSLYWMRWTGCEEGYKKQKIALEMENFSGKGFEAVLQEFWATVLVVNIFQVHCLDEEGALQPNVIPSKRINRSVMFGSLRQDIFMVLTGEISSQSFSEKFKKYAKRFTEKVRPGRQFSRKKVGKPKRHHCFRRTC